MRPLIALIILGLFLFSGLASATALSSYHFDSKEEEEAFRELSAKLRCLVCQNQSLADSDAELADDLRREVYNLWREGKSNDEIAEFLVARYGDFVLYDPPLKPSTYFLWFGPLVMLIIGAIVLGRVLRTKSTDSEVELNEEEQQRLKELLNESNNTQDSNK